MKYCKKCILPDTRPGLIIEDDLLVGGHGEDSHHGGGVRAGGEFPVVDFPEREVASFEVRCDLRHELTILY